MPVPASINDLSTTPGSNYPAGSESPATLDDYQRAYAAFIAQLRDSKLAASAVSTFMLTVLDDADAATARATLGANNASNLSTGTLADARLTNVAPTVPTLVNSFTNSANTQYSKAARTVHINVEVARATVPGSVTTIFTLPAGLRPAGNIAGIVTSYVHSGGFGQGGIRVLSTGEVQFVSGGTAGAASFSLTATACFIVP